MPTLTRGEPAVTDGENKVAVRIYPPERANTLEEKEEPGKN